MGRMKLSEHGRRDSVDRYMTEIRQFAMITAEEERDLAARWRDAKDPEAIRYLAGSHLRLVAKIARGFTGYGLPLADLISEGHVGLMQAAERFDPDRGVRFATYATWWVRASIQEYVLHSWSLVKLGTTAAQKKLFFNLRRLKADLEQYDDGDLSPEAVQTIAGTLQVSEAEVEAMNSRLTAGDSSLQAKLESANGDEWQARLVDHELGQEARLAEKEELALRRRWLKDGMAKLTQREQHIVRERRLKDSPTTLEVLSQEYGISRERVRQIEHRAVEKLGARMRRTKREAWRSSAGLLGPHGHAAAMWLH